MELITLHLNGEALQVTSPLTLAELLKQQGIEAERVATACNGGFVPRAARTSHRLQAGDQVLTFQAITGG